MTPLEFANSNVGHAYYSCKTRADQLWFWSKCSKFLSLAAAPGLTMIFTQVHDPTMVKVGAVFIAVGIVPLWAWEIFSLVFNWDRQLAVCRQVTRDGRKLYEKTSSLISSGSLDVAAIEEAARRVGEIQDLIINEHVRTAQRINIYAQQKVMSEGGYYCSNCGQAWNQRVVPPPKMNRTQRRQIASGARCSSCGQEAKQ